jgi:hypothetical protein
MTDTAENDVHLSYRLGGCATAADATAVTDAADAGRVTCPVCLPATRVTSPEVSAR